MSNYEFNVLLTCNICLYSFSYDHLTLKKLFSGDVGQLIVVTTYTDFVMTPGSEIS